MNFEDFRKAWQRQKPEPPLPFSPDALLQQVQIERRVLKATYFLSDMFIVGVDAVLIPIFIRAGLRYNSWAFHLMAFACFFVGVFILADRWIQRRKQPAANGGLAASVQSSLALLKHQIWRSKYIFWWYVLPLEIGFAAASVSWAWSGRDNGWEIVLKAGLYALMCGLIGWSVCWLSSRTMRKTLEPRREELEALLASLNENSSGASEPPPEK